MKTYQVHANGMLCGLYSANSEQEARDLAAIDAGYDSEADMESQIEKASELVADQLDGSSVAVNCVMLHDGGYRQDAQRIAECRCVGINQDWDNESTTYVFADGSAVFASGPEFRVATPAEIAAAAT